MSELAFEENGHLTVTTEFDFAAVERSLGTWEDSESSSHDLKGSLVALRQVLLWAVRGDADGIARRAQVITELLLLRRDLEEWRPESKLVQISKRDMEAASKALNTLCDWCYGQGKKRLLGLAERAAVVLWVFLPDFRQISESDVARGYGLDKQSVGRHVTDFKRCFPHIRLPHMRGHTARIQHNDWPDHVEAINRLKRLKTLMIRTCLEKWPKPSVIALKAEFGELKELIK